MPRGFLVKRHELLSAFPHPLHPPHPQYTPFNHPQDPLDLTSHRKPTPTTPISPKKLSARVWRPALPDDDPEPSPAEPSQVEPSPTRLCLEAALRWYQQRLFHPPTPIYPSSLASLFVTPSVATHCPSPISPLPPSDASSCPSPTSSDAHDAPQDLSVKSATKATSPAPATPAPTPSTSKKRNSAAAASPASKKVKAVRRLTFDDELVSPVSGTIITADVGSVDGMIVRPGDIDPAFNIVDITDEARAELAKIDNKIGDYLCRLCRAVFDDAFALAQHRCPRIVHVEYRCPECDKVFNCPANLASHRRWHKPRNTQQLSTAPTTAATAPAAEVSLVPKTTTRLNNHVPISSNNNNNAESMLQNHYQTVYGKPVNNFYLNGEFNAASAASYYAPARDDAASATSMHLPQLRA